MLFVYIDYLLFLEPATSQRVKQLDDVIQDLNLPPHRVFQTYQFWKGAVSLDPEWRERSNKGIQKRYGLEEQEFREAIQQFSHYLSTSSIDQQKQYLRQLEALQGKIFHDFVAESEKRILQKQQEPQKTQ